MMQASKIQSLKGHNPSLNLVSLPKSNALKAFEIFRQEHAVIMQ